MRYMSDQEIDRLSGAAGKRLAAEPKVEIVIAPAEGGQDVPWEGGLNGYFFRIPRGVRVQAAARMPKPRAMRTAAAPMAP